MFAAEIALFVRALPGKKPRKTGFLLTRHIVPLPVGILKLIEDLVLLTCLASIKRKMLIFSLNWDWEQ